jgi:hypothetical protein
LVRYIPALGGGGEGVFYSVIRQLRFEESQVILGI